MARKIAQLVLVVSLFLSYTSAFCPSSTVRNTATPYVRRHLATTRLQQTVACDDDHDKDSKPKNVFNRLAGAISQTAAMKTSSPYHTPAATEAERKRIQLKTLFRVSVPSIVAGIVATYCFPGLALGLASLFNNDAGVFAVLSQDSSQFVQNFLTVSGLLFSILVGQTFYFMYQQQETVYYALFNEVTEAKSLLEQVALVCQGRSMYHRCLHSIARYVKQDLKRLHADPAVLLSARPVDDPLESIMYMTSVGVPSTVYETVRSLRQARAQRLGALQRKLPQIHMILLWILALIELVSFPLLGAGTQTIGGYNVLTVEGVLFGVMTAGIVLTLRVVGELWRPAGGAYNVDSVLSVMVSGLEEELKARMAGSKVYASTLKTPSGPNDEDDDDGRSLPSPDFAPSGAQEILQQGPNIAAALLGVMRWAKRTVSRRSSR